MPYSNYIKQRTEAVRNCLAELGCQPIIFAGAGLSRRYINGPSWIELLEAIAKLNPRVKDSIAFLYQKHGNLLDVGEHLISDFHAWAWAEGREHFNPALFSPSVQPVQFIKYFVARVHV